MNDKSIGLVTWHIEIAKQLAKEQGIVLTADHWQVITVLRNFYFNFELHPALRILIKQLANDWPPEKAKSIYFYELFPEGLKQASYIAGLPKPLRCL